MSDPNASITRRQFCAGACQVASCATLASIVSACGGADSPTSPSVPTANLAVVPSQFANGRVTVTVTGTPLANVGGAARVDNTAGLFLVSRTNESTFTAVDGVCTHEGCAITGVAGPEFVCPCHGSRYNLSGQRLAGPATASLRQYATTFTNGVLAIAL
jgi:Rieske Fe-S protein